MYIVGFPLAFGKTGIYFLSFNSKSFKVSIVFSLRMSGQGCPSYNRGRDAPPTIGAGDATPTIGAGMTLLQSGQG